MKVYQSSMLRYIHDVATDEFANIGVVLWLPEEQVFHHRILGRYSRLSSFFSDFDGIVYKQFIRHIQSKFAKYGELFSEENDAPPYKESIYDVMKDLMLEDETSFQWGPVLSGICEDPAKRLDELFYEYVTRYANIDVRERRDESKILDNVVDKLQARGLGGAKKSKRLSSSTYSYDFPVAWKNGKIQVMDAISFDLLNGKNIVEKANTWSGRLLNLSKSNKFEMSAVIAIPSHSDVKGAFQKGVSILKEAPCVRRVVIEDSLDDFIDEIKDEIEASIQ